MRGNSPHFANFGEEGDISNICQFGWYEWIYFCEASSAFPLTFHVLGLCLGTANNEVNEMAQWFLKLNGDIVPRQTMRKLTSDELVCKSEVKQSANSDAAIKQRYGDSFTLSAPCNPNPQCTDNTYYLTFYEVAPTLPEADIVNEQEGLLHPTSMVDSLMCADFLLPQGGDVRLTKEI